MIASRGLAVDGFQGHCETLQPFQSGSDIHTWKVEEILYSFLR